MPLAQSISVNIRSLSNISPNNNNNNNHTSHPQISMPEAKKRAREGECRLEPEAARLDID